MNSSLPNDDAMARREHRFDPVLKHQLETTLDGVYAFNADSAKYGIVWVWIARLPMIAAGIAALVSLLVGLVLVISGEDIDFETPAIDPIRHVAWPLWFAATLGFSIIGLFLAYITKAVSRSHQISMELASRYRASRS